MASKQQESLKASWVLLVFRRHSLQPTATSSKVMKHMGRLMKFIMCICIRIIYIHIYIYGLLPSSPQVRNNFSYLEQDHSVSKDQKLDRSCVCVSWLATFNCTGHQWQGLQGDAWLEVVSCPGLIKRGSACTKNGCEQSPASQNLNQRCT